MVVGPGEGVGGCGPHHFHLCLQANPPAHILPECTTHILQPMPHSNGQPAWFGVGGPVQGVGMRPRQEGVNGDPAKSWKGGSGGGSPPSSQEFLKLEGGVGGTSGAVG